MECVEMTDNIIAHTGQHAAAPGADRVRYRPTCPAGTTLATINAAAQALGARLKADRAGIYLAPRP